MKVGKYKIPDLRLFPDIYNDIKLIYDNYRLEEAKNEDTVAKLLKHKHASGGSWWSKLADIRLYGLLEPRGIKLTPIAEKLTYGTEQEKQEAIKKIVLSIPLWKELHGKFGKELPESNFWVQLQRITGLGPLDARKYADSVRKAYLDDFSHIKAENEDVDMTDEKAGDKIDISTATSIEAQANIVKGLIVQGAYDIAKSFIDFIKTKKEKEETSEEEG